MLWLSQVSPAHVADVEGRREETDHASRADTMAKASALGSIVTVRRTTCWILKRSLPAPSLFCLYPSISIFLFLLFSLSLPPLPSSSFTLSFYLSISLSIYMCRQCNRQRAAIVLTTFMGVAARMKRDANSDTSTVRASKLRRARRVRKREKQRERERGGGKL